MQAQQGKISPQEPQDESDHGFAAVEESSFGLRSVNCKWSDEDIAAQCFLFFTAGFATTSLTLGFCAYEIMANPDVQKKLITEIDETRKMLNGRPIAYEDLQKMKYLDMVISEVLRKWPPQPFNDRVCTKPYRIENQDTGESVEVELGQTIEFPVAGLHYDPEYWPDPDKFDPERFNDENRQKIKPFSYLPFGIGPRNCIGKDLIYISFSPFQLLFGFWVNYNAWFLSPNVCEITLLLSGETQKGSLLAVPKKTHKILPELTLILRSLITIVMTPLGSLC